MRLQHANAAGMTILYVMASPSEYGRHLRARISPLITGIGPVEAAVTVTRALAEAIRRGALPRLVVSLGSAGSRVLRQTGIYQASSVDYRDMDATAFGVPRRKVPFSDIPEVIPLRLLLTDFPTATLSTGANVVSGESYNSIEAEMVDMETYAVLRACQSFGIPLIALRGISDGASDLHQVEDWTRYLDIIDEKLAAAVDRIEAEYGAGELV
ncbi:MAG TPA: 5'-methylthioadenosine/S-adenosylhomocysteine nucleosidase [Devosia sp.]|jgi:adenosylhomocysteine nucleosidase|nr:5'-methylthioadenosine/S-adenosylhomocysteine nucleosidase [Devosia sp.]